MTSQRLRPFLILLLLIPGCQLLWNGPIHAVQPITASPRAGSVYLVRGWIGVFSFGLDDLNKALNQAGIHALIYQDTQTGPLARQLISAYAGESVHEPIVLIGHSYGADDVIKLARSLDRAGITVDLLVTLDPVIPAAVPANVRQCVNYYKPNGIFDDFPWLRGIPLKAESPNGQQAITNINIADHPDLIDSYTNHFTIDKSRKVRLDVLARVLAACPDREDWLAELRGPRPQSQQIGNSPPNRPLAGSAQRTGSGG